MKPYSTHILPNGIRFLYHQTQSPVLYVSWGVAAGSAQERIFGTAHFCEHLMFTGTQRFPNYDEALLAIGATNNAWTDQDHTVYDVEAPPNTLKEIISIESDRWKNLQTQLQKSQFIREKQVIINERREYFDINPLEKWEERNPSDLFGSTHPYGHPIIGTEQSILDISILDIQEYLRQWYHPSNTVVCIAGQDDEADVLEELNASWGRYTSTTAFVAKEIPVLSAPKSQKTSIHLANTPPMICWQWLCHVNHTGPAEVIALLLSSSQYGILHRELVLNQHLAISVQAFVREHPTMSILELRVELSDESKRDQVYAYVHGALENIQSLATPSILHKIQKKIRLQWYMECEEIENFKDLLLCWNLYHDTPLEDRMQAMLNLKQKDLEDCMSWICTQSPLESHCYEET